MLVAWRAGSGNREAACPAWTSNCIVLYTCWASRYKAVAWRYRPESSALHIWANKCYLSFSDV